MRQSLQPTELNDSQQAELTGDLGRGKTKVIERKRNLSSFSSNYTIVFPLALYFDIRH